jgi:hypothetical protein
VKEEDHGGMLEGASRAAGDNGSALALADTNVGGKNIAVSPVLLVYT